MNAHTRLMLTVLWDDMERTSEHRHFESVEDLAAGIKGILTRESLSRSGVASLTIAPDGLQAVKREPAWRRAWAGASSLATGASRATRHSAGSAT